MTDNLLTLAANRIAAKRDRREKAIESGDGWEAIVDQQMIAARDAGRILYVTRNSPPWKAAGKLGKNGVLPVRLRGEGLPDWLCVVPGRIILGDDKSTQGARFPLPNVEQHQARTLDAWVLGGGSSVLLVRTYAARWVLDWRLVSPRYWSGQASLSTEEMDAFGERFTDDWLTAWEVL